jgi:hypothetical protein
MRPNFLSRNLRISLLVLGIALMLCSLAALIYALAPVDTLIEHAPLAPTLFSSP